MLECYQHKILSCFKPRWKRHTKLARLSAEDYKTLKTNIAGFDGLHVYSLCSGSEVQELVGKKLFELVNGGSYDVRFTCEQEEAKVGWNKHIMGSGPSACRSADPITSRVCG